MVEMWWGGEMKVGVARGNSYDGGGDVHGDGEGSGWLVVVMMGW